MSNEKIIAFYVLRIKNGETTIEAVPSSIRAEVEIILNNERGGQ